MSRFMNPRLSSLEEYTPGEQPKDKKYIKLNTNESPYPAPKGVIEAVSDEVVANLRLYCDPEAAALKKAIADAYGMDTGNVFLTNGSDDILNFAFLAFGAGGVVFPDISYGFYEVFARFHGLSYELSYLRDDFTVNTDDYKGNTGKLLVLANPNAPTGIALSLVKIEEIVKTNPTCVVLIDEAYVDFGAESCAPLVKKYDNLLCVQTFSKSRSMAGARLGFAFASPALIKDLEKIKYSTNPYNVNSVTQAAGVAAIGEGEYFKNNCNKIIDTREFVSEELKKLGFTITDSKANFIFAKSDKIDGGELYLRLKEKGVLIRHFNKPKICDYNRITVGSREEMEVFLEKVKEILGETK